MKPLLLTLAFLFQLVRTLAQNFSISGTVKDENDDTVMGAVVRLIHDGVEFCGLTTHYNGYYSFSPTEPGCYVLTVSYEGYRTYRIVDIDLPSRKENVFNVDLRPQVLQEVVIYYCPELIRCGGRISCGSVSGYYFPPSAEQLFVYPNPTSGIINIELQNSEGTLYITDMAGRTVLAVASKGEGRNTFNLSGLPDGMYVATYTYKPAGKMTGKFMILH